MPGCGDMSPAVVLASGVDGLEKGIIDRPVIVDLAPSQFGAFGRLRVAEPATLFDSKQVFNNAPYDFLTGLSGAASAPWSAARASTLMTVTPAPADQVIRQTRRYFNYQPGKSQLIFATFVMGAADATLRRRVGYFDANNGLFLEQDGTTAVNIVRRSNTSGGPVDSAVAQADWNMDKLDGTGPSGITLDLSKAQILVIDFEWLGVGTARVGFVVPTYGIVYAHAFYNSNTLDVVYMATPNLPVRYEITRTAGGAADATLEQICCTVISEGGQSALGAVLTADRKITAASIPNTGLYPILAIRLRAGQLRRTVVPQSFQVLDTSGAGNTMYYTLLMNPTRGAGVAPVWTAAEASSSVEYDVTSTQVLTGGIPILESGYAQGRVTENIRGLPSQFALGAQDIAGVVPDELVIAARAFTGTDNAVGSISWVEL